MREEVESMIHKAKRSMDAAESLFRAGNYDFACSRAYYSMFYMAEAVLMTKDLAFSKHSAVISAFGQHFVKTSIFDKRLYKALSDAFEMRQISDYSFTRKVSRKEAARIIGEAKIFIGEIERYLRERLKP